MRLRWLVVVTVLGVLGCHADSLGPDQRKPPYLAVLSKIETGNLPDPNLKFEYRIIDVSAGGVFDTTVRLAPTDTLILSVRAATYEVRLQNLPPKCVSRYGPTEFVVIPEAINTAIARFFVSCNLPLAITVFTAGGPDSLSFVWELTGAGGTQRTGIIRVKEEVVILNPLPPGEYQFALWNLPSNCEVTTAGRRRQVAVVVPDGGTQLQFAVVCSQTANRPVITSFAWSYHDSAAVLLARVSDPDRNLLGYYFDVTDCNGRSLLPGGEIERGGLAGGRTALSPTATIVGGYELLQLGIADEVLEGSCASVRVVDDFGNTTPVVERPPIRPTGQPPRATAYNAFLVGTNYLTTQLEVEDPDADFWGVFVVAELRDGTLRGVPDGRNDIGIYNTQGYESNQVPNLFFQGRIAYSDVYAQIIYLVDGAGNFRRLVDRDPFK